jgi:hypothetical protein
MPLMGITSAPPTHLLTGWALKTSQQQTTKHGSGKTGLKDVLGN